MPYIEVVCVAGKTVEIEKYYSYKWDCKGEKRRERVTPTPEYQKKINLRQAIKKLRRLMNANFTDEDILVTLDFRLGERPENSEQIQKIMTLFLQRLRTQFKKQGSVLKYIYVKELGKRGAAHIHMLMSYCETAILKKCWTWGGINIKPLHTDGQYGKIAEYFIKYADKTVKTEGKQIGKRWYPSRNLKQPVIKKRIIKRVNEFRTTIREKEGYYLEKESVYEGVTKDGYGYFFYSLHRIEEQERAG